MTLSEYLNQVKKRCDSATEGPWKWVDVDNGYFSVLCGKGYDPEHPSIDPSMVLSDGSACGEYFPEINKEDPNGKFIAHARQDVDVLLGMIEEIVCTLEYVKSENKTARMLLEDLEDLIPKEK